MSIEIKEYVGHKPTKVKDQLEEKTKEKAKKDNKKQPKKDK